MREMIYKEIRNPIGNHTAIVAIVATERKSFDCNHEVDVAGGVFGFIEG